ncbi:hypothetical protein [Lentibacillus daqui]|uniref:hypothetical protein n=1 Tax=Lentibacillus daqui TaxID=2911514 RepID=UPI0022B15B8B|nr:hypothetical protein [Lentibacillus daqui]
MSDSSLYFIPLMLMIVIVISVAEQVKMYSDHTNNAKYTKYCFIILFGTNVMLIIPTCFSMSFTQLYPFLLDQEKSRILVLVILTIGILLSSFVLHRLYKIKHNEDKHYKRIKKYEEAINV